MEKNSNQINLLEEICELPLSRKFFGFSLDPITVDHPSVSQFCFFWRVSVKPIDSSSPLYFWFNRLNLAEVFCRTYISRHSIDFWSRIPFKSTYTYDFAFSSLQRTDLWQ